MYVDVNPGIPLSDTQYLLLLIMEFNYQCLDTAALFGGGGVGIFFHTPNQHG